MLKSFPDSTSFLAFAIISQAKNDLPEEESPATFKILPTFSPIPPLVRESPPPKDKSKSVDPVDI